MTKAIPILRIFDYDKAIAFYVNWLGFDIDWEYKPEATPLYLQVSHKGIVLHLSEHHGTVRREREYSLKIIPPSLIITKNCWKKTTASTGLAWRRPFTTPLH